MVKFSGNIVQQRLLAPFFLKNDFTKFFNVNCFNIVFTFVIVQKNYSELCHFEMLSKSYYLVLSKIYSEAYSPDSENLFSENSLKLIARGI